MKTTTAVELTVLTILTATQLSELTPMVEALEPSDPDVGEALAGNDVVRFESVFESEMPTEMLQWFSTNKIPFVWKWEAFEDTGAGANFFDPEMDEVFILRMHENLVVMPFTEALDQQKVFNLEGVLKLMSGRLADLAKAQQKPV